MNVLQTADMHCKKKVKVLYLNVLQTADMHCQKKIKIIKFKVNDKSPELIWSQFTQNE